MTELKTKTGKTFSCGSVTLLEAQNLLYVRLANVGLVQAATIFSDPRETVQLWWGNAYYAGYTKLDAIIPEGINIRVCLRKE